MRCWQSSGGIRQVPQAGEIEPAQVHLQEHRVDGGNSRKACHLFQSDPIEDGGREGKSLFQDQPAAKFEAHQ